MRATPAAAAASAVLRAAVRSDASNDAPVPMECTR